MGCTQPAMYRFTWPGKDENYICLIHALKLIDVAKSIGLHVQLIPLNVEDAMNNSCSQAQEPNELE